MDAEKALELIEQIIMEADNMDISEQGAYYQICGIIRYLKEKKGE